VRRTGFVKGTGERESRLLVFNKTPARTSRLCVQAFSARSRRRTINR